MEGKSIRRSACSPRVFSSKLLFPAGGPRTPSAPRPVSADRRKRQIVSRPLRAYAVPIDMQKTYLIARNDSWLRGSPRIQFSRVKICSEASEESEDEVVMEPFEMKGGSQESAQRTQFGRCRPEKVMSNYNELSPCSAYTSENITRNRVPDRDARLNYNLAELETISNDGSDASQVSLGARIQKIATLQRTQIQEQIHDEACDEDSVRGKKAGAEDVWISSNNVDSNHEDKYQQQIQNQLPLASAANLDNFQFKNRDWQQLLEQNNELLSKLSRTDSPFPPARNTLIDNECSGSQSASVSSQTVAKVKKPVVAVDSQVSLNEYSDEDDLNDNKTEIVTPPKKERYFSQSSKTIRPITPVTPDCVLEDINEESSEDELDSLLSDYKSAAEDTAFVDKNKRCNDQTSEMKIPHVTNIPLEKMSNDIGKIVGPNKERGIRSSEFPIIFGEHQQCSQSPNIASSEVPLDTSKSTVSTEFGDVSPSSFGTVKSSEKLIADQAQRQPTPETLLDQILSVPPRSEFLSQKNALAELLLSSTQKRKEQLKQESNKTNAGGCCNRCSCLSVQQSSEGDTEKFLVDKTEGGVGDRVDTPKPGSEKDDKLTVSGRQTLEDTKPPTLSEMLDNLLRLSQGLSKTWLLVTTNEDQRDDEESKELLLQVHVCLLKLCQQVGVQPQAIRWPELHTTCKQEASRLQSEVEARLQKSLDLSRKLLDDKKQLAERCEERAKELRDAEARHQTKVQQLQARQQQELQDSKQRLLVTEQAKRDKWTLLKTKAIKESSFRGLETRIKDLVTRHRDEISQLKADHWQAVRAAEERCVQQLRQQEQQLRARHDEEREEAVRRERDREQQRMELQLQQSAQAAREQTQAAAQAHQVALRERSEQCERTLVLAKREHEGALERALTSTEQIRRDLLGKMADRAAEHKAELQRLSAAKEDDERRLREDLGRQAEAQAVEQARAITDRLKRQRDRDIEKAVRGVQQQAQADQRRLLQQAEHRYKRLLASSEEEASGAQRAEAALRARLMEARAEAAQREEEAVCLRARLHQQHQELHLLQQMVQTARDGDGLA